MQTEHNIRLTSSEIASIWSLYMNETMSSCVLEYFLNKVEDIQVKPIIEKALHLSQEHVVEIKKIFQSEDLPVPHAFTKEDVNIEASRLYSDTFMLDYIRKYSKFGMGSLSICVGVSARSDICEFFNKCLISAMNINNESKQLLLSKGVYVRYPYVTVPKDIEFVKNKSFLGNIFDSQGMLNVVEITHITENRITNQIGKALIIGFSQVCKSEEIRDYFIQGREIAAKHSKIFGDLLQDDHVPAPHTWDADIMDSNIPPFSDKLMLYHISTLNSISLANYGAALSQCMRKDVSMTYTRLMAEIGQYLDDGAKLMIQNGWMEQIPLAPDRDMINNIN